MSILAINGGKAVRTKPLPPYSSITDQEIIAATEVLKGHKLSGFLAEYGYGFLGGQKVKEFENLWSQMFDAKYTVSVNSATSGLIAAVGALGLGPGDEIICSPYSMSASASCVFVYGAVPVFADVQDDIFTMDPVSIEKHISPYTKAILVVHIFGHSADMDPILSIAKKYNLKVIEDCAQAPLSTYKGRKVGTLGDIGVFSLNIHKHIQTGEGGMITTNDEELANKLRLIRNHGELSIDKFGFKDNTNLWGFNFRLTEIHAAIGLTQLKRLEGLVEERIQNCNYVAEKLSEIPGITAPVVYENCKHVYYMQAFKFNEDIIGVTRNKFIDAVLAELPDTTGFEKEGKFMGSGYVKPLYLSAIYQQKIGTKSSFNDPRYKGNVSYEKGICPVVERLHYKELFVHEYMRQPMTKGDMDDFIAAFNKVYENREELK